MSEELMLALSTLGYEVGDTVIVLPEEVTSYRARYPICVHPQPIIYPDGSQGSRCSQGAYGLIGQKPMKQAWSNCHYCKNFRIK